ncbi:MAG: helix-turn-helix domain-containing protein [Thermodesulfobacteriota bacterium]|jgi:transcriptional regulator with GAF, ATPase, and Fis domain
MISPLSADFHSPEVKSLFAITRLPRVQTPLEDYFRGVMAILSDFFSVGYSALILHDPKKDALHVEALYGIGKEVHPHGYSGRKGLIAKVLESQQPTVIKNLSEEPLYDEVVKGGKRIEKIQPPLICFPLVVDDEPIGVINISSLYGPGNEFIEDFQFLSVLSAILSPVINNYHLKKNEGVERSAKGKTKSSLLDEILEKKLSEVLNRIDPDVESKIGPGIFDDIIGLVEKILIKSALERMGHVQTAAAQFLGINRNTLRKKIKDLKIKAR